MDRIVWLSTGVRPGGGRSRSSSPLTGRAKAPLRPRHPAELAAPAAGGHHNLGRVDVLATREPDAAGPPVAGPDLQHTIPYEADLRQARRFPQGGDVAAVVDGPVAREEHAAVHVGGEEGLHVAARPAVQFF